MAPRAASWLLELINSTKFWETLWGEIVRSSHQEYQGTCSIARSSVMINKDGIIDWSVTVDRSHLGGDPRDPREEGRFSEKFWEWVWWHDGIRGAVVLREEIRILVPPDARHRLKTRIVELPAVPRSSFEERQRLLVIAILVETTVTLGTADQLVHITGLYPEIRLVQAHSRGHEFLERRCENP